MNVFAFTAPHTTEWRWRIVDERGDTLEESSTRFPTMADALVAGAEQVQLRRDRDRPAAARVPWHRRR